MRKLIIEENPINPKYYDRMSQLLDELIAARRSQAIAYQAYLDKIVDLTRQAKNPHAGGSYPATVDTPARKALYDNLDSDEALTLAVDEAVHESRQDDWRGNRMKQKRVKLAIRSVLGESDPRVDDVFDLVTNQNEY